VTIFDPDGNFLGSWGEGVFKRPHGIYISPDDFVYCTDDAAHIVMKCTLDGKILMTLGNKDQPSDTGYDGKNSRSIKRPGPPFNRPTNVAVSAAGDIYVSDGYGNSRVHRFTSDGKLLHSWGESGRSPGQFCQVHSIRIDAEQRAYIPDRENHRIQVFTLDGKFLAEWTDMHRPAGIQIGPDNNLYVSENPVGNPTNSWSMPPALSVWSREGKRLAKIGGEDYPAPGHFNTPHALWGDSRGNIYVGENSGSAYRGKLPQGPGAPLVHKLMPVR
jgi:DNA-binding beta-propeller fold protein YncE